MHGAGCQWRSAEDERRRGLPFAAMVARRLQARTVNTREPGAACEKPAGHHPPPSLPSPGRTWRRTFPSDYLLSGSTALSIRYRIDALGGT